MLGFITGFAIGAVLALFGTAFLAYRLNVTQTGNALNEISKTAEKLVMARKYFGLIANRESIGEARKVANKALKELLK